MIERARQIIARGEIAEKTYILVFCLVYLMHSIWPARTILWFVLVPVLLLSLAPYRNLLSIVKTSVFVMSAAFLALILATSALAGETPVGVIANNARYAVAVLAFLIITAHLVSKNPDLLRLLILFVAPAAALSAATDIVQFSGLSLHVILTTRLEGIRGLTTYYNSNVIGMMFAFPCVGAVAVMISKKLAYWQFALLLLCSLILFAAVVLTGSRGSLTAMLAGIGVSVLLSASWRISVAAAAVIATTLGLLAATPLFGEMLQRGDSLRLTLWLVYLHMAALKPWLGYGLAFDTQIALREGVVVMNAHNIVLCALVRGGVLSAAALSAIMMFAFVDGWRAWRRHDEIIPLGIFSVCVVATSVDYEIVPTDLGYLWILFWLPVGVCLGASLQASTHTPASESAGGAPGFSDHSRDHVVSQS